MSRTRKYCLLFLLFAISLSANAKNIGIQQSRSSAIFAEKDTKFCSNMPLDFSIIFDFFDKFNFGISVSHFPKCNSHKLYHKLNGSYYAFSYEQFFMPLFIEWKIKIFKGLYFLPVMKIGINGFSYESDSGDGNIYTKEDNEYKIYKENQKDFAKIFFCMSGGVSIKYLIPSTNLSIGLKGEITYPFSWEETKYILTTGGFVEFNILR